MGIGGGIECVRLTFDQRGTVGDAGFETGQM